MAGGSITFEGEDLASLSPARLRAIRGKRIGMIFQEPMTALNPLMPVGRQIAEVLEEHARDLTAAMVEARVQVLLEEVGIPDPPGAARAYPHELSGGQRQRAMIAMALAMEPKLLIADEPTTALDVTTQARILALIKEIQARRGTGVLFITHDFGVVAEIADRVAVMQQRPHRRDRPGAAGAAGTGASLYPRPGRRGAAADPPPARAATPQGPAVLVVEGLRKTYRTGGLFGRRRVVAAVQGVSFTLHKGETLGIVGESGSGKSTVARTLVKLLPADGGSIRLNGTEVREATRDRLPADDAAYPDGLPGPLRLAQPAPPGRRPHRPGAAHPWRLARRGPRHGRAHAGAGRARPLGRRALPA